MRAVTQLHTMQAAARENLPPVQLGNTGRVGDAVQLGNAEPSRQGDERTDVATSYTPASHARRYPAAHHALHTARKPASCAAR